MEILKEIDLRTRTMVRIIKLIDGFDVYFRNEKTGQIEIVHVAKAGK